MIEVRMPRWGMNMKDGTVVAWLKQVGDRVEAGEPIAEIETAKTSNTLESPATGVLARILVAEEETVVVQTVLAVIEP